MERERERGGCRREAPVLMMMDDENSPHTKNKAGDRRATGHTLTPLTSHMLAA
jgi:hypothetical protein